jgi:hypothetical protein
MGGHLPLTPPYKRGAGPRRPLAKARCGEEGDIRKQAKCNVARAQKI